jgi:hypothetical protein
LPTAAAFTTVVLTEAVLVRGFAGAFALFIFSAILVLLRVDSRPNACHLLKNT